MWWVKLPIMLLLLVMARQDFKYRAIAIWLFVLVGAGLVFLKYEAQGWSVFFADLKMNLVFLTVQLTALFGYFAIKERKFVNLFKGYFGEGDLLFLVLLAGYISFFNFLLFHISTLFLMLLLGLYLRKQDPKIPLAGAQAFCLALLMLVDHFVQKLDLTQDFWQVSFYP